MRNRRERRRVGCGRWVNAMRSGRHGWGPCVAVGTSFNFAVRQRHVRLRRPCRLQYEFGWTGLY
jgi:hypothetical protein